MSHRGLSVVPVIRDSLSTLTVVFFPSSDSSNIVPVSKTFHISPGLIPFGSSPKPGIPPKFRCLRLFFGNCQNAGWVSLHVVPKTYSFLNPFLNPTQVKYCLNVWWRQRYYLARQQLFPSVMWLLNILTL